MNSLATRYCVARYRLSYKAYACCSQRRSFERKNFVVQSIACNWRYHQSITAKITKHIKHCIRHWKYLRFMFYQSSTDMHVCLCSTFKIQSPIFLVRMRLYTNNTQQISSWVQCLVSSSVLQSLRVQPETAHEIQKQFGNNISLSWNWPMERNAAQVHPWILVFYVRMIAS